MLASKTFLGLTVLPIGLEKVSILFQNISPACACVGKYILCYNLCLNHSQGWKCVTNYRDTISKVAINNRQPSRFDSKFGPIYLKNCALYQYLHTAATQFWFDRILRYKPKDLQQIVPLTTIQYWFIKMQLAFSSNWKHAKSYKLWIKMTS